jgi:hypothetical protein
VDDVRLAAEAEFEADRRHDAAGEEPREQVALLEAVDVPVQLLGQARGVVALRKAMVGTTSRTRSYCSISQ